MPHVNGLIGRGADDLVATAHDQSQHPAMMPVDERVRAHALQTIPDAHGHVSRCRGEADAAHARICGKRRHIASVAVQGLRSIDNRTG